MSRDIYSPCIKKTIVVASAMCWKIINIKLYKYYINSLNNIFVV